MTIEDALLYIVIGELSAAGTDLAVICAQAVAGGADIVRIEGGKVAADAAVRVSEICGRDNALFIVGEDPGLAAAAGAQGVHFGSFDGAIGLARATLGFDAIIGFTTRTVDEARLALELGADYLVHNAGAGCRAAFAALRDDASVPLFAGGISGLEEAAEIVESGIYRLCIDSGTFGGNDVVENVAGYSRLLGRLI